MGRQMLREAQHLSSVTKAGIRLGYPLTTTTPSSIILSSSSSDPRFSHEAMRRLFILSFIRARRSILCQLEPSASDETR
jgi:hypothetical protein